MASEQSGRHGTNGISETVTEDWIEEVRQVEHETQNSCDVTKVVKSNLSALSDATKYNSDLTCDCSCAVEVDRRDYVISNAPMKEDVDGNVGKSGMVCTMRKVYNSVASQQDVVHEINGISETGTVRCVDEAQEAQYQAWMPCERNSPVRSGVVEIGKYKLVNSCEPLKDSWKGIDGEGLLTTVKEYCNLVSRQHGDGLGISGFHEAAAEGCIEETREVQHQVCFPCDVKVVIDQNLNEDAKMNTENIYLKEEHRQVSCNVEPLYGCENYGSEEQCKNERHRHVAKQRRDSTSGDCASVNCHVIDIDVEINASKEQTCRQCDVEGPEALDIQKYDKPCASNIVMCCCSAGVEPVYSVVGSKPLQKNGFFMKFEDANSSFTEGGGPVKLHLPSDVACQNVPASKLAGREPIHQPERPTTVCITQKTYTCEICGLVYANLKEHLESVIHKRFAQYTNWTGVDAAIEDLSLEALISSLVAKDKKCHTYSACSVTNEKTDSLSICDPVLQDNGIQEVSEIDIADKMCEVNDDRQQSIEHNSGDIFCDSAEDDDDRGDLEVADTDDSSTEDYVSDFQMTAKSNVLDNECSTPAIYEFYNNNINWQQNEIDRGKSESVAPGRRTSCHYLAGSERSRHHSEMENLDNGQSCESEDRLKQL